MKLTRLLFYISLCIFLSSSSHGQSLAHYGNNVITRQEFLRAFKKNNTDQVRSEKAIRDYLELYIRFKLKVKAAYDLKLDTLSSQKAELEEFGRQIASGFLKDESSFKVLVQEAFLRSQKDIHLGHIFIPTQIMAPWLSRDTLKALKFAMEAYHELQKGTDFAQVASLYSSDPSVKANLGDVGYITVFTLPYEMENIVYSTPVGQFSRPYLASDGYHIFKNLGERKALGKMKVAQILFAFPDGASDAIKASVKRRADSVYVSIQKGASFDQLADKFTNENTAYAPNGILPEFGVGNYEPGFEAAVFALSTDNEISKPIASSIGYHIVKRIESRAVNANIENDSAMTALKEQVEADARIQLSNKAMHDKIIRLTGVKKNAIPQAALLAYLNNSLASKKQVLKPGISDNTQLISLAGKKVTVGDWIQNIKSNGNIAGPVSAEVFGKLQEEFIETKTRDYYLTHLEKYDADYAAQLQEFKEGNLLFEVMQRNIWDKATSDSTGLRKYFENNKRKYWSQPGVEAVIFNCVDSSTAYALKAALQQSKDWRSIISTFENRVQADSGRFELSQLPGSLTGTPKSGMLTEPLKNVNDGNISFLYIVNVYPEKAERSFDDARGFVLSDYQGSLEEKWITMLKKKYPVKIDETVLKSLWK